MANIKIEWLSDHNTCETCGSVYASGARVYIDGEVAIEMKPAASCFGGKHYEDSEVYARIFERFGHTLESEY